MIFCDFFGQDLPWCGVNSGSKILKNPLFMPKMCEISPYFAKFLPKIDDEDEAEEADIQPIKYLLILLILVDT